MRYFQSVTFTCVRTAEELERARKYRPFARIVVFAAVFICIGIFVALALMLIPDIQEAPSWRESELFWPSIILLGTMLLMLPLFYYLIRYMENDKEMAVCQFDIIQEKTFRYEAETRQMVYTDKYRTIRFRGDDVVKWAAPGHYYDYTDNILCLRNGEQIVLEAFFNPDIYHFLIEHQTELDLPAPTRFVKPVNYYKESIYQSGETRKSSKGKRSVNMTVIGFVLVLLLYVGYYPVTQFFCTYTSSTSSLQKHEMNPSPGIAEMASTNRVNIYNNRFIIDECDQGCEIVNFYWMGARIRDGHYAYHPQIETYFSSFALKTDSIVRGNRLVLYFESGDSIAKVAKRDFAPRSIGNLRRRYACHTVRRSYYSALYPEDMLLIRTQPIVSLKIESQNDVLTKPVSPEAAELIRQRFVFLSNSLRTDMN